MNDYISANHLPDPPFDFEDFKAMAAGCWWVMAALGLNLVSLFFGPTGLWVGGVVSFPMYLLGWLFLLTCPSWTMPWAKTRLLGAAGLFFAGWWSLQEFPYSGFRSVCGILIALALWVIYTFFYDLGWAFRSEVMKYSAWIGRLCVVVGWLAWVWVEQQFFGAGFWDVTFYLAFLLAFLGAQTMLLFTIANIYSYK